MDHPSDWSDYRPISRTSNLCTTFERVIAKYIVSITSHISSNNNQHGFLTGRCTQDAIIQVLFNLSWLCLTRQTVLFDLSWLTRWIANYLSNR